VSDGVLEAKNASGDMFSFARLERVVRSGPRSSAQAMLTHLRLAIETFTGETEPHDDLTIVVARIG
jgi:serine phosphatase RsbU (regulator of sigma subunit)